MRILQIISANDINGAVMHVRSLIQQLEQRGHSVYLACPPNAWLGDQLPPARVLHTSLARWPAETRRVARWIADRGIEVTHSHQSRAHAFGIFLRWGFGIPSVATAHNCRIQLHWALNNQVIGVSEQTTRFHRRWNWVSRRHSHTIHNFIDTAAFPGSSQSAAASQRDAVREQLGIARDDVVGVILGSVAEQKGLGYAMESLPTVVKQQPNFRCLIVGKPRRRDEEFATALQQRVEQQGLGPHVIWAGAHDDVGKMLLASDMLISASLEENFPISMLEAMACGLPIVGTRVGGVPELVSEDTGLLVRPRDATSLGQAVASLATDAQLRKRLGEAGLQRVQSEFSAQSQVPKIESVLAAAANTTQTRRNAG